MSIADTMKMRELEQRIVVLEALLKSNGLQADIESLKSRVEALESRPRPGRPPKEQNGRQPTS